MMFYGQDVGGYETVGRTEVLRWEVGRSGAGMGGGCGTLVVIELGVGGAGHTT